MAGGGAFADLIPENEEKARRALPMIDKLERSDVAAQRSGVPVDQVTSPAGALGRYQVMPATGALYGFGPDELATPEGNQAAALANLADLAGQGFTDPALMAAGYNGGPKRAAAIRDGQAGVPRETQDYYGRALKMVADGAGAAANAVVPAAQAQESDPFADLVPKGAAPKPDAGQDPFADLVPRATAPAAAPPAPAAPKPQPGIATGPRPAGVSDTDWAFMSGQQPHVGILDSAKDFVSNLFAGKQPLPRPNEPEEGIGAAALRHIQNLPASAQNTMGGLLRRLAESGPPVPAIIEATGGANDQQQDYILHGGPQIDATLARNTTYLKPGLSEQSEFKTKLTPAEEKQFQTYLKAKADPRDLGRADDPSYDLRGWFKAMQAGDPRAALRLADDGLFHRNDYWKTPYHPSFSAESLWAGPNAPKWQGNKLVDPQTGAVVHDDDKPVDQGGTIPLMQAARQNSDLAKKGAKLSAEAQKHIAANAPNIRPDTVKGLVSDMVGGAIDMAPLLAATVATRSSAPLLAGFAAQGYGDRYATARQMGRTPEQADGDAMFSAAAQTIPAMLPLHVLMKPGGKFMGKMLQSVGGGAAAMEMTKALQLGYDKGTINPDMTWGEAGPELVRAGLIGAGMGAAFGVAGGAKARIESMGEKARVRNAQRRAQGGPAGEAPTGGGPEGPAGGAGGGRGEPIDITPRNGLVPVHDPETWTQTGWKDPATGRSFTLKEGENYKPAENGQNRAESDAKAPVSAENDGNSNLAENGIERPGALVPHVDQVFRAKMVAANPEWAGESTKTSNMLAQAIQTGTYNDALHPSNKNARATFEEITGVKLPDTVSGTKATFTGQPFQAAKPARTGPKSFEEVAGEFGFRASAGSIAAEHAAEVSAQEAAGTKDFEDKHAPKALKPTAPVQTFTTAKGSTYQLHEDGTTTRDKAARTDPGHEGQSGPQPRSQRTYFVTPEHADQLSLFQTQGASGKMAVATTPDGKVGVKFLDGPNAGKFERRTVAAPETAPAPGLTPVETWADGTKVHFGNPITAVGAAGTPAKSGPVRGTPRAIAKDSDHAAAIIARSGGIRDDEGHDLIKGRGLQQMVPGAGPMIRPKGMSIDAAGELLWNQGFFGPPDHTPRPSENDVLQLLERTRRGADNKPTKVFSPLRQVEMDEARDSDRVDEANQSALEDVHGYAKTLGETLSEQDAHQILADMGHHGIDHESAVVEHIERKALREVHSDHEQTGDQAYGAGLPGPGEVDRAVGTGEPGPPARPEDARRPEGAGPAAPQAAGAESLKTETGAAGKPQTIIPGAEASAQQLAQAKEAEGKGKIKPRAPQKDAGGMFEEPEENGPDLFEAKPVTADAARTALKTNIDPRTGAKPKGNKALRDFRGQMQAIVDGGPGARQTVEHESVSRQTMQPVRQPASSKAAAVPGVQERLSAGASKDLPTSAGKGQGTPDSLLSQGRGESGAGAVPALRSDGSAHAPSELPGTEGHNLAVSALPSAHAQGSEAGGKAEAGSGVQPVVRGDGRGNQEPVARPDRVVADAVQSRLDRGAEPLDQKGLTAIADKAFGGTAGQGVHDPRRVYDAMETGINQHIAASKGIDPTVDARGAMEMARHLRTVEAKMPIQSRRTGDTDAFQQFSTPPHYAYAAAWAANLKPSDVVLEPSAGNGGLAVFAKKAGAKVVTNELGEVRRANLQGQGFDMVTGHDAEQIHNLLPSTVKPSVVLMNPPFSNAAQRGGIKDSNVTGRHIDQALETLAPGGRLVAITGHNFMESNGHNRSYFQKWAKDNQIRASVGVSGKVFSRYGTSYPTRVIVIDKAPPDGRPTVTGEAETAEALIDLLKGVRDDRPAAQGRFEGAASDQGRLASGKPASDQPGGEATPGDRSRPGSAVPAPVDGEGAERPGSGRKPSAAPNDGVAVGSAEGDGPKGSDAVSGAAGQRAGSSERPEGSGDRGGPAARQPDDGDGAGLPAGEPARAGLNYDSGKNSAPEEELAGGVYSIYRPQRLKIPDAWAHPAELVQSAAMATVEPPVPTYKPSLDPKVIKKGLLSEAQLEPVVYAGQAHAKMLPDGETRRGFFIGDGTGVGKGREISGVILDNWNQGRKKHVWVSEKWPLLVDAKRDWTGVGGDEKAIISGQKFKQAGPIEAPQGILFTTYDTLKGKPKKGTTGQTRVDQIVNWLGKDFDGVVAFDEAHNMANADAKKGTRGTAKPAEKALAGLELQKRLPKARIVYVSATGATEVNNLAYAERLGLWGPGTPFPTKPQFMAQIEKGGVAAMELVARDLKQMGSYLARGLSFNGVEYGRLEHKLSTEQRAMYDSLADAWQMVLTNIDKALEITGGAKDGRTKSSAYSAFWGSHQRFFNQILTSMQMPTVLEQAGRDLKEGRSPVFQLVNTNEAASERALARVDEEHTLEDLDLTPRDQLMQMVEHSFPVAAMEEYLDESGNKKSRPVLDAEGNVVQDRRAVEIRDKVLDDLSSIRVPDGPLEYLLNKFGPDTLAEVTGRGRRVVIRDGKRVVENRPGSANTAEADAFMSGKKKMLVFSQAGGTGRSYHADKGAKNQNRRVHYLLQPGWSAAPAIQGFGRTHRSNQTSKPMYQLATTDVVGQKRFMSSIARRLDQLGALTKGERRSGGQGFFSEKDNLESNYADDAVTRLVMDIIQRKPWAQEQGLTPDVLTKQMGLSGVVDDNGGINVSKIPDVPQFLNRLLSLKLEMQDKVFNAFDRLMEDNINAARAAGTLDQGVEQLQADHVAIKNEQVVHTDKDSGAQTKYVALETKRRNKPITWENAERMLKGEGSFIAQGENGRAYLFVPTRSETDDRGNVVPQFRRLGANRVETLVPAWSVNQKFEKLEGEEARAAWDKEVDAVPEFDVKTEHMISGALLPIWDRLPSGFARVMRAKADNGESFLGRMIKTKDLQQTLKNLGATGPKFEVGPDELFKRVRDNGDTITLANGWKLTRRTVSGEQRMKIVGPNPYSDRASMERLGLQFERIGYEGMFFVPDSARGRKFLEDQIGRTPIVSLGDDAELSRGDQDSSDLVDNSPERAGAVAPDGTTTQALLRTSTSKDEILDHIAKYSTDPEKRQLARALKKTIASNISYRHMRNSEVYNEETGNIRGGFYRHTSNLFTVHADIAADPERAFLHEAVHAATVGAINERTPTGKAIDRLFDAYQQLAGKYYWKTSGDHYGFLNSKEFVAEILTKPKFRKILDGIKAEGQNEKSLFQKFIDIMRRLFRLPPKDPLKYIFENEAAIRDPKTVLGGAARETLHYGEGKKKTPYEPRFDDESPELNRDRAEPPFFSALTRAVEGMKQEKAPAQQWAGAIKNLPGVKQEELDWSGVNDWLAEQTGPVTKDAVLQHLRDNEVQVHEVMKGGASGDAAQQRAMEALSQELRRFTEEHGLPFESAGDLASDLRERMHDAEDKDEEYRLQEQVAWLDDFIERWDEVEQGRSGAEGDTKWADYTLPGGKDYRELLLTMPERGLEPRRDGDSATGENWRIWDTRKNDWLKYSDGRLFPSFISAEKTREFIAKGAGNQYKSSHWDEPNILAHVRFDDREGPNGEKTLHVAEIQSDWHQAGRKKGYKNNAHDHAFAEAKAKVDQMREAVGAMVERNGRLGFDGVGEARGAVAREPDSFEYDTPEDTRLAHEWSRAMAEARRLAVAAESGVPDAPFKHSWHEMAMKRILRHAAENGYDAVTWDTGDTQNKRFGLERHFTGLKVRKGNGDYYHIVGTMRDGQSSAPIGGGTAAELPDYVGQELAARILADLKDANPDTSKTYSGLDLKTGGEGQRGFYDEILPKFVNKLGKKWGAKVGRDSLGDTKKFGYRIGQIDDGRWQAYDPGNTTDSKVFDTKEEAKAFAAENQTTSVHRVDITPAMRESVLQGQPLFMRKKGEALFPADETTRRVRVGPKAHQLEMSFTPKFDEARGALGQALRKRLDQMGLRDIALKIPEEIRAIDNGKDSGEALGSYWNKLIAVAMESGADAPRVLNHEAIHALHKLGLIDERDWQILAAKAPKWIKAHKIESRYAASDMTPDRLIEEAAAHEFETNPTGAIHGNAIKRIFRRIAKFFEALRNAIHGLGFRSYEDVFASIDRGDLGAPRPRRAGSQDGPEFARRRAEPEEEAEPDRRTPLGRALGAVDKALGDAFYDVGKGLNKAATRIFPQSVRDAADAVQMAVTPMAAGSDQARATAKDFANMMRQSRVITGRQVEFLQKKFTPEQLGKMWEAADEESVLLQQGEEPGAGKGLARLTPDERKVVKAYQAESDELLRQAKEIGLFKGEGLPSYVPRMVVTVGADGSWGRMGRDGARPYGLDALGRNVKTNSPNLKHRKHLTTEETEEAAQGLDDSAMVVRDFRTLPLAMGRLQEALAGRTLVNRIKAMGTSAGEMLVSEGVEPNTVRGEPGWFTLDHPAFKTYRPSLSKSAETGKWEIATDANGNPLFERIPIFIRKDFEGPLRAVLSQNSGKIYQAAMTLKGKTMSIIMWSPLMHNAVIWGKAFPAAPLKLLKPMWRDANGEWHTSIELYGRGRAAKNDPEQMKEAIQNGLDPIGHRYFNQDISAIMEQPNIRPGRSWTAQIMGYLPGLYDKAAGDNVRRRIDQLGDVWHNKLLWDLVGDLQMGMYQHLRDSAVHLGHDQQTAGRYAAHFSNRYAGALPIESMSRIARQTANMALFSRSFTLTNLGAFKDLVAGLPKDVQAQVQRDGGLEALNKIQGTARRKAASLLLFDIFLSLAGLTLVQHLAAWLFHHVYHPPSQNEPDREHRALIGYDKDGTAIYARLPWGKVGEEFQDWPTKPVDITKRKLSPFAQAAYGIVANDRGFGRKIYDPYDSSVSGYAQNAWRVGKYIAGTVAPFDPIQGLSDVVKGEGDQNVNWLKVLAPMMGVTISKGAPGGPAIGQLYASKDEHEFQVQERMPEVHSKIRRGDVKGAVHDMSELGLTKSYQKFVIRVTQHPGARMTKRQMREFMGFATPEEKRRMKMYLQEGDGEDEADPDQHSAVEPGDLKGALRGGTLEKFAENSTWSRAEAIRAASSAGMPATAALLRDAKNPPRPELVEMVLGRTG